MYIHIHFNTHNYVHIHACMHIHTSIYVHFTPCGPLKHQRVNNKHELKRCKRKTYTSSDKTIKRQIDSIASGIILHVDFLPHEELE